MKKEGKSKTKGQAAWLAFMVIAAPLCGAGTGPQTPGSTSGANPAINQPYQDPNYDRWVQVFERSGREVFDRRLEIVENVGLRPGMTVADIGAGTGLFTRLFAARVGAVGKVIAVDISDEFARNILRTSRQQGLTNVEAVVNTQSSTGLAPESIDLAFICDTYHHFEYPQAMMSSVYQALRSDGEVIIIDFRRVPGSNGPWIMDHVREGKEGVIREMQQAGFRFVEAKDFMRSNYFLRFVKDENGP